VVGIQSRKSKDLDPVSKKLYNAASCFFSIQFKAGSRHVRRCFKTFAEVLGGYSTVQYSLAMQDS
jgi:hypothetical protein